MAEDRLTTITGQYPILYALARQLSTFDLFHLSFANKALYSNIQPPSKSFKVLTRESPCDGHGLIKRQEFQDLYFTDHNSGDFVCNRRPPVRYIRKDEPIEVQLWALKCGESDALPCLKCGINVCEECRFLDREAMMSGGLSSVPFPHSNAEHENFMALCPQCDAKTEQEVLEVGYASTTCDCDTWTRWICLKCRKEEIELTNRYIRQCTKGDWGTGRDLGTKNFGIHQSSLYLWCFCGNAVPQETGTRCTWCKRRHIDLRDGWRKAEEAECARWDLKEQLRYNPGYADCPRPYNHLYVWNEPLTWNYPKLRYDGPIWSETERQAFVAERGLSNTDH